MDFVCEDISQHGVVLVPVSAPEYDKLLTDIQRREANTTEESPPFPAKLRPRIIPEDRPTSAILLNRSTKAIAGLQAVWRFETESGRTVRHSRCMLSPRPLVLPFGFRQLQSQKKYEYWNTIFPGSTRYIGDSGIVGDNRDVRPPTADEKRRGGVIGGVGDSGFSGLEVIRQVTLALDGIFFLDGEFVGPDTEKMFESTVAEAEAHRIVARIASDGHYKGLSAADILIEIEKTTGTAPERPPLPTQLQNRAAKTGDLLKAALQGIAYQLDLQRASSTSNEQVVLNILSWDELDRPQIRRN